MFFSQKKSLIFLLIFLFIGFSCAPPAYRVAYRAHPELEIRSKNIRIPGLAPPDIKIYELTAGGIQELRDDWSSMGKENVLRALIESFNKKQYRIKTITINEEISEEMEDIQALYRAVNASILLHTYGPYVFPEKQKNFDYSIGSIEGILQRFGADAIIFVYGFDEISTSGRKALTVLSIIAGAFTGVAIMPRAGITTVSVALVDASGAILWYSIRSSEGRYDLRDLDSASMLLKDILSDFPELGK
jgi:hypothetical protein